MNEQKQHLENLYEIRAIMERSSRFISLSGLSGVFAGIFALIGAGAAYLYLNIGIFTPRYYDYAFSSTGDAIFEFFVFFFADAISVLVASLAIGSFLTIRKARKKEQRIWDHTSKRLLINLLIPLVAGGVFCLVLLYHGLIGLVAPATLIFYGLALLNASKYTLNDIRYLGICELALGLFSSVYIGYGLLFWAAGFGLLHIVYGAWMYKKYEQ